MRNIPKYAQLEHERRFLVRECPDVAVEPYRQIEDLYIAESRLRLRKISSDDGRQTEFKLCKKYPTDNIFSGPITNIYLTSQEHEMLSRLSGARLRKRRYRLVIEPTPFSLDVFEDKLRGLVLCEAETPSAKVLKSLAIPEWAAHEVTGDPFFSGGNLATVQASDLKKKLISLT